MADLKAFRKANKLTQEQVADYLGIKKPFICKIETGREGFPDKHLQKLLDNPHGWDVAHLVGVSETIAETNDTPEQPTEDVVVISTQVLEEMAAQRQLAEQAIAVAQDQLAVTNEALLNAQRNLTTEQQQVTTSQAQLTAEQQHTRHMIAQVDELIIMLKNAETKLERELDKMQRKVNELENRRLEHDDEREQPRKPNKNDA